MINRLKYVFSNFVSISQSSKNWLCKMLGLANQQIFFSLMTDVFSPKRISPDCPFRSNQKLAKISILTPQYAFWLRGVTHTTELNSAECCTPRTSILWGDAYHRAQLRGVMQTAEWCTPWHWTPRGDAHRGVRIIQKCPLYKCFCIIYIFLLRFLENFWSRKDSLHNFLSTFFSY